MICSKLFGGAVTQKPTDFYRFDFLRGTRRVVESWIKRAWELREVPPEDSFEPFIYTWFAFNAWAECVTGEERDNKWVKLLALEPTLTAGFDRWPTNRSGQLATTLQSFRNYWPIPKMQDWRRFHLDQPSEMDRHVVAHLCIQNGIEHAPKCAKWHFDRGEDIPRDWPHFLYAVYRVRCNRFHGKKSPCDLVDQVVVQSAFKVLICFLHDGTQLTPDLRQA